MQSFDEQTLRHAKRALNKAVSLYLYDPNVSHIDLGYRIIEQDGNRLENELTVRVHLRKKLRGDAFKAFAEKYPDRVINAHTIGFPIDIPQANYRLSFWAGSNRPHVASLPRARRFDPLHGGISISNEYSRGYATLGGRVIDRQTGDAMILSNFHVLGGYGLPRRGVAIYQPAWRDGGRTRDTIAYLSRHAMQQNLDAAVARLDTNRPIANDQFEIGRVAGAGEPELGMQVIKSGRGSQITEGMITGLCGHTVMHYRGIPRLMKHIAHIGPRTPGAETSLPGDSGSFWIEENSRHAVALHFAGADRPEFALGFSMPRVLQALNVTIA